MDDLFSGLVVVAVGAFLVMAYVALAGGAAAVLGVLAVLDAVAFFVWRLGSMVGLGVQARGGDRRVVAPPEPAFEIYFGRPLARDFRGAFGVALRDVMAEATKRRAQAFGRFKGAALPLAFGVAAGAYLGAAVGVVFGGLAAVPLGLAVLVVSGAVWAGSRMLLVVERVRRRVRGAHFDCPSCHDRAPLPVYVCPGCGAKHRELLPGRWGVRRRRCECDAVSLPALEMNGRHSLSAECPHCAFSMPGASGIVPEIAVPIVGGPKAGKTAFLASLLVELNGRTQSGASRLSVVESSRAAFDRLVGDLNAGRVPDKTQVRAQTPAFVAEVRSGASRSALLYAHDLAGELYQQADQVRDTPYLVRARGAVVLIDPFSLRTVGAELDAERPQAKSAINPSAEDPQSVVERFLQALRESGRADAKKLPVAVVVSKCDALVGTDALAPGAQGEEVARWLDEHGAGNLVRTIRAEFDTHEFFTASALGRLPDGSSGAGGFVPVGTLSPFTWLLAANKVSLSDTAAATEQTVTEKLGQADGARQVPPRPRTPLFAPRPRTAGAYAAGLTAALFIVGAISAGAVSLSTPRASEAYANTRYDQTNTTNETNNPDTTPPTTDTTNNGTPNTAPTTAAPPPAPAPTRVMRKHYRLLASGNYDQAFMFMSPSYRNGNPNWVSERSSATPRITRLKVGLPEYKGDTAFVGVRFYAQDQSAVQGSDTQCRRFRGRAVLRRYGGAWRYEPVDTHYSVAVLPSSECGD